MVGLVRVRSHPRVEHPVHRRIAQCTPDAEDHVADEFGQLDVLLGGVAQEWLRRVRERCDPDLERET
jgi:hypothetical protein